MEHKRDHLINGFFFLADFGSAIAAALLSIILRKFLPFGGTAFLPGVHYTRLLFVLIPFLLLSYLFSGQYRKNRGVSIFQEFLSIFKSVFFAVLSVLAISFFYREYQFSRLQILYFFIIAIFLTFFTRTMLRLILRSVRRKGRNLLHIVLIGEKEAVEHFKGQLANISHFGYAVDHIFLTDTSGNAFKSIRQYIGTHPLDGVFYLQSLGKSIDVMELVRICEESGVRLTLVSDTLSFLATTGRIGMLGPFPVVNINETPLDIWYSAVAKRLLDIFGSFLLILLTLPLQLVIALIIRITSRGPVVFVQERVGYNRRSFRMYKFRTMRVQSDRKSDTVWTTENDPRKTRLGAFLRKVSLDELPQLYNVLLGQMSLVGPRPERPFFVDEFRSRYSGYLARHQVRSGMTGWAQVNGLRGDTSIEERIRADMYYIRNWSLLFDIRILVLTILRIMTGRSTG